MDFKQLADEAMKELGHSNMRPVIEKELLHYEILQALSSAGLLNELTFQGGTCLRLCYGSNRYSEDLDFVGGRGFVSTDMKNIQNCIHQWITKKYNLPITVEEPKNLRKAPDFDKVHVDVWQIKIETAPERRDLKRQMIKIEIANIEALTKEYMPLLTNYTALPEQSFELYPVQSLQEILCDKLIALVNSTKYIRYRDLWDIAWLANTKNVTYDQKLARLITHKITDYHIENYGLLVENFLEHLHEHVMGKEFRDQMTRFLPIQLLEGSFEKRGFLQYLERIVGEQLDAARKSIKDAPKSSSPFTM